MIKWNFLDRGKSHGPISSDDLQILVGQGQLTPWTAIQRIEDDKNSPWRRAGEVKGLFPGDVTDQLGGPICGKCGTLLSDNGRCDICAPPPVVVPSTAFKSADPPTPDQRYPHLRKYLGICEVVASIVLVIGIVGAVFIAIAGAIGSQDISYFFAAIFIAATIYLGFLSMMATIQVVYVLLDIEASVRQTEINTRRGN